MTEVVSYKTHKEILAKLDYPEPSCPRYQAQMAKYDFQRLSKIPYLELVGYKCLIRLKKRRFKCYNCGKIAVAETSLVAKNHQIPHIVKHKIKQLLIEKVDMTDISRKLGVSTTTVLRQLKQFKTKPDLTSLPEVMSWDEYSFKKGKISFIAQDFESGKLLAIFKQ